MADIPAPSQTAENDLPFAARLQPVNIPPVPPPQSGDLCPICRQASLEYDGLLELVCRLCGYRLGGGAGCT